MTKSLHSPETLGGLRKFCDAIVEFAERMRADLDKLHDEPDATVLTVGIARRRADLIGLLVPNLFLLKYLKCCFGQSWWNIVKTRKRLF